jgi:Arc/MetJ-type ribon-helix-helix transcriptional regulator
VTIPSELEPFVAAELASGAVSSEAELIAKALGLYREMKKRHEELRAEVKRSLGQARQGDVAELDVEQVIARGYERLAKENITDY